MDNQKPIASEEKINEAKRLLALVGFENPANRLASESIILSKYDDSITVLIDTLKEMLDEKETAYKEFKRNIADIAKEMLPPKPQAIGQVPVAPVATV